MGGNQHLNRFLRGIGQRELDGAGSVAGEIGGKNGNCQATIHDRDLIRMLNGNQFSHMGTDLDRSGDGGITQSHFRITSDHDDQLLALAGGEIDGGRDGIPSAQVHLQAQIGDGFGGVIRDGVDQIIDQATANHGIA